MPPNLPGVPAPLRPLTSLFRSQDSTSSPTTLSLSVHDFSANLPVAPRPLRTSIHLLRSQDSTSSPATQPLSVPPMPANLPERHLTNFLRSQESTSSPTTLPSRALAMPSNQPGARPPLRSIINLHRDSPVSNFSSGVSSEAFKEIQEKLDLVTKIFHNFTLKVGNLNSAGGFAKGIMDLHMTTFGELDKLEPLEEDVMQKWKSELDVIFGVFENVDKENSLQQGRFIDKHLPYLKKLDDSLMKAMRMSKNVGNEVKYQYCVSKDKVRVKVPVVKSGTLSEQLRGMLYSAERDLEYLHKQAREVNLCVLKSMPVPNAFTASLPRHAKQLIPEELREDLMSLEVFNIIDYMKKKGMYSKEKAVELCSMLEKVELVWHAKSNHRPSFSRRMHLSECMIGHNQNAMLRTKRCRDAICDLRREFITMKKTELDMQKVSACEDIDLAGLEAYSRALESRAHSVLSLVRDVLLADGNGKFNFLALKRYSGGG